MSERIWLLLIGILGYIDNTSKLFPSVYIISCIYLTYPSNADLYE